MGGLCRQILKYNFSCPPDGNSSTRFSALDLFPFRNKGTCRSVKDICEHNASVAQGSGKARNYNLGQRLEKLKLRPYLLLVFSQSLKLESGNTQRQWAEKWQHNLRPLLNGFVVYLFRHSQPKANQTKCYHQELFA